MEKKYSYDKNRSLHDGEFRWTYWYINLLGLFRINVATFELIIKYESRKTIYLLNYRTQGENVKAKHPVCVIYQKPLPQQ